jgi:proteasome lid subunit RPN8/RPN11
MNWPLFKSITIPIQQKQNLLKHSKSEKPNESCALLFGKCIDGEAIIKDVFLTRNAEESPVNFTMDSMDLFKGYHMAEERNLEVVGIFHSHPNSKAYPSATDQKFMFTNPVVWAIHSGDSDEMRAFTLDSKEVNEIPISIIS